MLSLPGKRLNMKEYGKNMKEQEKNKNEGENMNEDAREKRGKDLEDCKNNG